MAIQYYMRAFNTALVQYVDWVVNDTPDSTGVFSGYPTNQLINITVNRVVQSKVANFLKKNQSLGGTDGYFFHVNSYDWRNATAPINPPTNLVGFAVERGIASVAVVSGATNASPIVITTSAPHGLSTGQIVTISGVTGNVAANGTWPIVFISTTSFSLVGSVGTGTYSAGTGTVYIPNDMSSLIWDETSNVWRLATIIKNNPGDSVTLGVSQSLKVNNFILDGYIAIGLDPADTGAIRLSNNTYIFSEANPTGTDVQLIGADLLNRIKLGVNTTDTVYIPGIAVVDGYIQHDGTGSNTAQTTGFIREQNSTNIIAFRGTAALAGSDIVALASSSNNVVLGDSVNTGILYNTSSGSIHQFQTNSAARVEIGDPFIRFVASGLASAPTIFQTTAGVNTTGQTLTIQAQNGGSGTSVGGILALTSGTGTPGTGTGVHGTLDLLAGGTLKMRVYPTIANPTSDNNSIKFFQNVAAADRATIRIDSSQLNPLYKQDDTASGSGQTYTVQAQSSIAVGSTGGFLNLTSGTGVSTSGNVNIQTGNTTQIIVSPTFINPGTTTSTGGSVVIRGSLEVVGTTTTVDSTIVDIIGRMIHANWADPAVSSPVAVPSQVVGYSVHRGNIGAVTGVPRDGAALIWTEGALSSGADGYWRHVTYPGDGIGTDNFTIANSLNAVGTMANDFAASSDPNPVLGFLASTGSFRAANNVPTVVGRSNQASTTLTAAGLTNGSASLPLTPITVTSTTGFTGSGTLLIQSSAGIQTVTYTSVGATQFNGVVGGTGTIVTGGIVAQTNNSTTFNGANGTAATTGTITVVSTVGFPTAGTLRIVSHTSNASTAPVFVQTITYTGGGGTGTTFTGCSGAASGFFFVGDAITSVPSPGISDLPLVATDFGNRVLHGFTTSPTGNIINNTGHIFNTPTGFVYDFQVNSVSQIVLGNADIEADGYAETVQVAPTIVNPRIYQLVQPNTGANNGFNMLVQSQAGQQQTGGNNNNNGGILTLASGPAGTGGGGTAGVAGVVTINVGSINNSTFNNIDPDADGYAEWLAVGPTILNPRLYQATLPGTGAGVGTNFKINAQQGQAVAAGTNNNGGNLVLASGAVGTGGTAGTNGQIEFFWGSTLELTLTDGSLQWSNLVGSAPVISQAGGVTTGQAFTIQAQNASTTGGNLVLTSGTGTTAGNVSIQTGAVDKIIVHPTFTEFRDTAEALRITPVSAGTTQITFAATDTAASINQTQTAATPSANMTVQSQVTTAASGVGGTLNLIAGNATGTTSTGGAINLASGSGTTTNGVINFQPGGTTQVLITATGAQIQWVLGVTAPTLKQNDNTTNGATAQPLTVQAQNATGTTSTGGAAVVTSGTGTTTAGNVQLQTGAVDRVIVHPTFTEFRDTSEAYRITPVSAGATTLQAINTATSVTYKQGDLTTASGTGATTTVQAQNETGTTSTGGALNLTSGTGTTTNGAVNLQVGGTTTASLVTNKFVYNKGQRRNVTSVTTTYQVLATDDYIAITSIAAPFTITLPATPTTGDTHTFKDAVGNAATNNVTISGNGANIDGAATVVLTQNYSALVLTYTGTQWSIS